MRSLFIFTLVAALGWMIYWAVGSAGAEKGFEVWFEDRRSEGWQAEYSDLAVKGFPNRFDATFTEISLADPDTGLAWSAPFFQLLALSYKPNHVIAIWPHEQRLSSPEEKFDLKSQDMRASVVVRPQTDLGLERLTLTANALTITPLSDASASALDELRLAAERLPITDAPRYRLGLSASNLEPGSDWKALIDPQNRLPDNLEALTLDAKVTFDKPWDITAIQDARPQPVEIDLAKAEARWGQLALAVAGQVSIDATGTPSGAVTIKARNWREILEVAKSSGALSDTIAGPLEDGLALLSQLAGNPKTLDIPLKLSGGRVWLGPVPIAPAPQIKLR